MTATNLKMTSDDAKASIAAELERIAVEPDAFPAAMAARARMPHRYSIGNQLLIMAQTGDVDVMADRVMPASEWAKLGFTPAYAPVGIWSKPFKGFKNGDGAVTFKREQADKDAHTFSVFRVVPTYPAGHVADENGKDGRTPFEPLTGDAGDVFASVSSWLESQGWTVQVQNVESAGGWTSHDEKIVRIDGRFEGWDRVRVIVHEAAHAILHGADDPRPYEGEHRGDMEAEADGVAYAVLMAHGQTDAAARSVAYVAGWAAGDGERVKGALDRAACALDVIMGAITGEAVEINKPKPTKADNRALAAWLRDNGLEPTGEVWAAVKAGERDLENLRKLAGTVAA